MKHFYLLVIMLSLNSLSYGQCTIPVISETTGPINAICAGSSATLTATSNGESISWFNSQTGGSQVGSGSPLQTTNLSATTSFWAEAQNIALGVPASGGGKLAPTSTGGTTVVVVTSPWGLAFTATQNFILNTVDVFLSSSTPGNIIIQLKDASYNIIDAVTVAAPAGGTNSNPVQFTVPINMTMNAGSSYKLVVESGPAMIRDLGTNSFPYPIGAVGTITGGTINDANTNPGVYYFLYNWNFTPIEICASERSEVVVTVINTPAPTGAANQTFNPGETVADLDVTGENMMWFSDAAGTIPLATSTPLTDGNTYYVNQTVDGCPGPLLAITVTQTLAVIEQELQKLAYFPNPVEHTLFLSNEFPITCIGIYSIHGQQLMDVTADSVSAEVDLSALASGTYIAKIESEGAVRNIRIIKE